LDGSLDVFSVMLNWKDFEMLDKSELYVLVEWPESQEFMEKEGVRYSDESSCFVPVDVYERVLSENRTNQSLNEESYRMPKLSKSEKRVLAKIRRTMQYTHGTKYMFCFTEDENGEAISWEGGYDLSLDQQFRNQYTIEKHKTLVQNW